MNDKLVSVIIPAHNRADTLKKAVESALAQSHTCLEVIIINDASTDDTEEMVSGFSDKRVIYLKNETQLGANVSRNRGIEHAHGELIAFLDSADLWINDKLKKQITWMDTTGADIVFCAERVTCGEEQSEIPVMTQKIDIMRERLKELLAKENCIDTSTLLVKRACFSEVGMFDIELPRLQEYEWLMRAVQKFKISYFDEILVDAYIRADSISSNIVKLLQAVPIIYRKHSAFLKKYGNQREFLASPIKELHRRKMPFEEYQKYFKLVEAALPEELIEEKQWLYEDSVKHMVECDYVNRYMLAALQSGDIFSRLMESQYKEICIFGAGKVSTKICNFIKEKSTLHIRSLIVTSVQDNASAGFPILEVEKCGIEIKELPIIVAVEENVLYEVLCKLQEQRFSHIICLTDDERAIL